MLVYSAVNLRTSACLNLWTGKIYSFATLNTVQPINPITKQFSCQKRSSVKNNTESNNGIGNNGWSSERARGQCTLATLAVINYDQTITIKPPITAAARSTRAYAQLRCCALLSVGSTNAGLTSGLSRRAFHRCFTLHNSCLCLLRPINKVY